MVAYTQLPLAANWAIFATAAASVWFAGAKITRYADALSAKTGMGHALLGLLLLAGVTSTPESGVTVTAVASGDEKLAVNNLLGSIAMQVALLSVVAFPIDGKALTSSVPEPTVMPQGSLNVLLLAKPAVGIVPEDFLAERRARTHFRMGMDLAAIYLFTAAASRCSTSYVDWP